MKLTDIPQLTSRLSHADPAASQEQVREALLELGYDPDNFYQELEMSSPLVDTHRDISYSNANMQLHSHDFYELLYCCSNCGMEYLVGTERYRLQRGDVILVTPGVSHRPLLPEHMPEPYQRYVLWLSREFMEKYMGMFALQDYRRETCPSMLRTAGTQWEDLGEYFLRGVQEAEQQRPGWEAIVTGNTILLLTLIGRAVTERSASLLKAETPALLDRMLAYIQENLSHKITLGDVAKQFYVSQSTVSQTFRKTMGVSFYRYLTQRRLIAAKTLIQGEGNLEQIGRRVGFSDYTTFYRAFRKEYGISPQQYRRLQDKDPGENSI